MLTNPERDSYPFALVFSLVEIIEAAASSAPNPCSWYSCSGCVDWFFESVVGRIIGSGYHRETVVGSLWMSSGCTSYRCLQQDICHSSASYQDQDPMSWRSRQEPHPMSTNSLEGCTFSSVVLSADDLSALVGLHSQEHLIVLQWHDLGPCWKSNDGALWWSSFQEERLRRCGENRRGIIRASIAAWLLTLLSVTT